MSKVRLLISTDMQMISGVNHVDGDKDDVQSLVHALMYQDKVDIVGIISSTSNHQPGANDDVFIHRVIDEYGKDRSKLDARADGFKTADQLHDIVYQGTKSLASGKGYPAATEASKAIIREAREAGEAGEKLYVATWGGLGDVARALHDAPDIAQHIRLLSASGPAQEPGAYRYIREEFAGEGDLWWVDAQTTQRGIYAGPEGRLPPMSDKWAEDHADGHGALGKFFYQNTQDVRGKGDDYDGVKMGDSWGIFYLIDKANNSDPTAESWGGEYRKVADQYWVDRTDQDFKWKGSDGARTTYEDRAAWTSDFAKRFDWLKGSAPDDDRDDDNDRDGAAGPDGAIKGTSGDDRLSGDAGDRRAETFFFDTAFETDFGFDRIARFGEKDRIVTTSKLMDGDGDGIITFGDDAGLDLRGKDGRTSNGHVQIRNEDGGPVLHLEMDQFFEQNGVTYYAYSMLD